VERVVEQDAGDGRRVGVGALHGEIGSTIEVCCAQADLGQALPGAERGGEVEQGPVPQFSVERARSGPWPPGGESPIKWPLWVLAV
jgi:hypothetical protein